MNTSYSLRKFIHNFRKCRRKCGEIEEFIFEERDGQPNKVHFFLCLLKIQKPPSNSVTFSQGGLA